MKITPEKLAKAITQVKLDPWGRTVWWDMLPHWKKLQFIEDAKIVINALKLMKRDEKIDEIKAGLRRKLDARKNLQDDKG